MILRIILLILFIPVLIILIALLIYAIPLPQSMAGSRDLIAAITAGIASFGYLIMIFLYTLYAFKRAGRILDKIALELKLEISNYNFFGRQYKGSINNRKFIIQYFPRRMIYRALLNIYISGNIDTGIIVSRKRPIFNDAGYKILDMDGDKLMSSYKIYTKDGKKTKSLLEKSIIKKTLDRVFKINKNALLEIYFQHSRIWLRMRVTDINENDFMEYIKSLQVLISGSEDLIIK